MPKFIITDGFFELFPEAEIGIVLAKGLDPGKLQDPEILSQISSDLREANKNATKYLAKDVLSENKVISVWREAFQKFKTKKGARSSIEAMLKRISKGNEIGMILPLVDIYNTVSLNYAIPCGGEDIDTIRGDMLLTIAEGGEPFKPLGSDEIDNALPNEVIYKDEEGAVCRCWNWREGERTMLTENTKNAFLIIESVDPERHDEFVSASEELEMLVKRYFACETEICFLNINNRELEL